MNIIAVEPTICHLCGMSIVIRDDITADADSNPYTPFEDLIEHECTESEEIYGSE